MSRYLMWLCKNHKKDGCDEAVMAASITLPEPNGSIADILRYGDEQEALDKKCEICPKGLFEMDQNKCPVCHEDHRFKRSEQQKANFGIESVPDWFYLFTCEQGHNLCKKKDILD